MASDTDLWLGLKARQARYKNVFGTGTKKELSPVEDERSYLTLEGDKPDKPVKPDHKPDSLPVKKHDTDELDKKLKAKRAVFTTKGRSLSLASFRLLPSSSSKKHHHKLSSDKSKTSSNGTSKEKQDEKYLQENRAQGELEILNLESLINVNDVRKRSSK